jgi:hypothetical protein
MKEIIYDLPKESLEEDLFGWAPIVNRISDIIKFQSKVDHSCFTIGVYGKWGEGKTSLMNMVCENLKNEKGIKIIHFNPWLFKDQESLLLDYFKTLQSGITNKKVVEKIKKYGPLVSIGISGVLNLALPGTGSLLKGSLDQVIDAVSEIKNDLASLKKEVNDSIILSKQHYLIIIDDVDRLDKDELHTLFKLVRQNADFVNTTYMIAMDAELVAKSIGCRFESGDEKSGKNFLEKIIQVPFFVPKVQQGHLNKMLNTLLLPKIEILLSESGKRTTKIDEIKESLNLYVSPLFNSAREIIVYINSLTIILPLVYKDVNISDLCLLEALKLFHPKGYNIIRQNKLIITDSIEPSFKDISESPEIRQHKRNDFIEKLFENIESDKTLYLKEIIERLLGPFISPSYHNNVHTLNEKSICSSYYFNNYFQYTHPDDIISDDETDRLIEDLGSASQEELIERFEFYYKTYGIDELKRVVYLILHMKNAYNINNDTVGLICVALARLSINKTRRFYTEPESGFHIEFNICDILNSYVVNRNENKLDGSITHDYEKQIEIIENIFLIEEILPFHLFLATHLYEKCNVCYSEREKIDKIFLKLIQQNIENNGIESMFTLGQTPTTVLFGIWKMMDSDNYTEQVNDYINNENFDVVRFVSKMIYNTDDKSYEKFCELFDADKIFEKLNKIDPKIILENQYSIGYFMRLHKINTNQYSKSES